MKANVRIGGLVINSRPGTIVEGLYVAALMAVEHAPERKKGIFGSATQMGSPAGSLVWTRASQRFPALKDTVHSMCPVSWVIAQSQFLVTRWLRPPNVCSGWVRLSQEC